MADLPPCSSSSMEEWHEKRGLQTMNLRSVFTLEQQRVLESYYDNGMTNQSKSCFQLILQCAQETKLDFSVVRLHSRLGTLSLPHYKTPSLSSSPSFSSPPSSSPPGPPINSMSKRVGFPTSGAMAGGAAGVAGVGGGVPRSWARQYGSLQSGPWPSPSQPQTRPQSNHQTLPPHPPRPRPSPSPHPIPPPSDHSPRIHQVFSLSERGEGEGLGQGQPSDRSRLEKHRPTPHPSDTIGCLSIAMETGDEEDEWRREEELSNMAATAHGDLQRGQGVRDSPSRGEGSGERVLTSPSLVLSSSRPGPYPRDSYPVTTTLQTSPIIQVPVSPSAPWLISNSRKRTLQDRTQFSDVDLGQLKRYWDRGMTSLGSVCREKINAAANQLNVDTEIVKTWIGNRRRKYRLMGIEIPFPKCGPAVFLTSQEGEESPSALSSDGEGLGTPELGDNLNDGASFCLSEDGTSDSYQREEENGVEDSSSAPMVHDVKIEVIDDDDDDDDGVEMVGSDMENMQNLLEFKLEEVQYLESQLENQNQRYYELETFTKSLLTAVRTNNLDRQQELLASLPQPADQDWDMSPEGGANPISITTNSASNHESPLAGSNDETPLVNPNKDLPLVTVNEDGSLIAELNESSVSEELETETGPE
ncbi:highly divergent homeobox isoform X3 [Oncorhynchus mykiss]|uniref:highly divergent homeobox isoform X3 n=1 Tax=Oncorhynchus mykiss TaxID=8022 RepID=UPI001878F45B|nr:highly divergent homeobox isoform X3 [Oncorhynchus mykiss]